MAAVTRLKGDLCAVKIGGSVFNKCRRWEFRPRWRFADGTAAGDTMVANQPLRAEYEFTATFILSATAPFVEHVNDMGTSLAWVAQLSNADTNGYFSGTGYISEHPVVVPYDDVVEVSITIIPDGSAVTIDTSPAT